MKNKTTLDHSNDNKSESSEDPTETSSFISRISNNWSKKKKMAFFKIVKSIFSKPSRELEKKDSLMLLTAIRNTYVIRENHSDYSHKSPSYEQISEESNSYQSNLYYEGDSNLNNNINNTCKDIKTLGKGNVKNINRIHSQTQIVQDDSSWISISSVAHETQSSCMNIFGEHKSPLKHVDIGIQTKIPTCYKVFVLHKHVSNCNIVTRMRTDLKSKQKFIFKNSKNKFESNTRRLYVPNNCPSTEITCRDKTGRGNSLNTIRTPKRKFHSKEIKSAISHLNKPINKEVNFQHSTNNDSMSKRKVDPASSGISVCSSRITKQSIKKNKLNCDKIKHKTLTEIKKEEISNSENSTVEESKSRSLPSFRFFRKNKKDIKQFEHSTSPLVNQNKYYMDKNKKGIKKNVNIKNAFDKKNNKTSLALHKNFIRQNNTNLQFKESTSKTKSLNKSNREECKVLWSHINRNSLTTNAVRNKPETNCVEMTQNQFDSFSIDNILSDSTLNSKADQVPSSITATNTDLDRTPNVYYDNQTTQPREYNLNTNNEIDHKSNSANDKKNMKNYSNIREINRTPIFALPAIFYNEEIYNKTNHILNKNNPEVNNKVKDDYTMTGDTECIKDYGKSLQQPTQHYKHHENLKNLAIHNANEYSGNVAISINISDDSFLPMHLNTRKFPIFSKGSINNTSKIENNDNNFVKTMGLQNSSETGKQTPNKFLEAETPNKILKGISQRNQSPLQYVDNKKVSRFAELFTEENLINNELHEFSHHEVKQMSYNNNIQNKPFMENDSKTCIKKSLPEKWIPVRKLSNTETENLPCPSPQNVGIHGIFSGNISSKRKTFYTKKVPMLNC